MAQSGQTADAPQPIEGYPAPQRRRACATIVAIVGYKCSEAVSSVLGVHMQTRRTLLSAGILLPLAARTALAQGQSRTNARATAFAGEMMKQAPVPALSLAVMRGGDLAWSHAIGTADIEANIPVTTAHK